MKKIFMSMRTAVKRCRVYALTIFATYCISCTVGIVMVHNGNEWALSYRDKIVGRAAQTDKSAINQNKGNHFTAAVIDFYQNLLFAAVPQTLMGMGIVVPYLSVTAQGWVGGIVSVDGHHKSRLARFKSAFYYIFVLLLQFIPFSLTIGAGIKFGLDFYNTNKKAGWSFAKYKIPMASLADLGYVYLLAIPLFFIASCYEFISSWNI